MHVCMYPPIANEPTRAGGPYDMGGIKVREFCCSELRDTFHEVVHRSDARAEIKVLKRHGGMVGFSQDEVTLAAFLSRHRISPVW